MGKEGAKLIRFAVLWILVVILCVLAFFSLTHALDTRLKGSFEELHTLFTFFGDSNTARYILTSSALAIATLFGIVITVVLIVVQLTANRYTTKIIDLFINDWPNVTILGVFLFSIAYSLMVANTIRDQFYPAVGTIACFSLLFLSFSLLVPYFYYVFNSLKPTHIIDTLKKQARKGLKLARQAKGEASAREKELFRVRADQISDICKGSMNQMDSDVTLYGIWALEEILDYYQDLKVIGFPSSWFEIPESFFLGFSHSTIEAMAKNKLWVEMKVLREYNHLFGMALETMKEAANRVAYGTHIIALKARATGDEAALDLAVKFFNTYLRASINKEDKFSTYNVLYQYRQMAEEMIGPEPELCEKITDYILYYGHLAEAREMEYIIETALYDVGLLCQKASEERPELAERILEKMLKVLDDLRTKRRLRALKGSGKICAILGSFFLMKGKNTLGAKVRQTLKSLEQSMALAIRDELLAVADKDFWEITDRMVNFEYIEKEQHQYLKELLGNDIPPSSSSLPRNRRRRPRRRRMPTPVPTTT